MRKFTWKKANALGLLFSFSLFGVSTLNAQLTGTKTIPTDYASVSAFVADLNTAGVGTSGVTLNVPAGYTETLTGQLTITATGTASDPIIIQKSGVGANPVLTSYTGVATPTSASRDGMLCLSGTDYLTINGINFQEAATNITETTCMEYAIGLFKASVTDGAQNNTIKNCVITLNRLSFTSWTGTGHNGSCGIVVLNCTNAANAALIPTAASGSNSNNVIESNTIQNVNAGIVFVGYGAPSPFTLGDQMNVVGGNSSVAGNSILNFGGAVSASNPSTGIFANNQWDMNCSYNTVNNNNGSGVNHVSTLRGIFLNSSSTSASVNCNNNNITIHGGGTTSQISCIENSFGSTAAGNTVNLNNNTITGSYLTATTGVFYGIFNNAVTATNVNILNNTVSGINYGNIANTATGVIYPIYSTGISVNIQARNNLVNNISRIGSTGGTTIGIFISAGTNQTVKNNTVSNMSIDGTGTASTMYGMQTGTGTVVMDSNLVFNLNCLKTAGSGLMYGIYNIGSPTNENYNYNTIYNLNHQGTGTVYGITTNTAAGTRTFSYNLIYSLFTNGNTIAGYISTNSSPNIFNNKIYNIEAAGVSATASGLMISSVGTSGTANVFNNVIGDIKAPNASSASNVAPSVRGINITSATATSSINLVYNTVYLNATSVGANFTTAALFHTGNATATTANLTIGNNIFHNGSTAAGTGITAAFIRGIATATNLNAASNRNNFYAGPSSSANLIYFDGANSSQTVAAFQTLTGVGTNSVSTSPNYLSTTGSAANFLRIDATIPTLLESGGASVASIPTDIDGQIRFGSAGYVGTGIGTDIGADEFEGTPPGDIVAPVITLVSLTPGASCTNVSHVVVADVSDNVGVTGVSLSYSFAGVPQTPITMTLLSGNALSGTYTATIPAAASPNVNVTYSVLANDALANNSIATGTAYADNYLLVTASQDVTVNSNANVTISASVNTATFANNLVKITEVVQFKGGTGDGTYPAYIPTVDNDYIEITNISTMPLNVGGFTMTIYGAVNGTYTIPANTTVLPQSTVVLAFAATTNSPANNYYGMGLPTTSSTVLNGYVLRNSIGSIVDAVALNGYTFLPASGVTAGDWSGNIPLSSAGVRRTAAVDGNVAADWAISSATNLINIGTANIEVAGGVAPPQIISWTPTGGTTNPLTLNFPTAGTYTYTASYSDGTCTSTDQVVITVITPITPVANFSGTPLAIAAGSSVSFTDLSTNIPTSWAWVITPSAGVTYTSGTTAASQNPVVSFANAGSYTVQLTATNSAGSNSVTNTNYIIVSPCAAAATQALDTDIGNVTFAGINQGSATPVLSNPLANGTYSNFTTGTQATVVKGSSYPISLSQITSGATFYAAWFNVFIDWNGDGIFDPTTERAFTSTAATSGTAPTQTGTIIVPANAVPGPRFMRVMLDEGGSASSAPCTSFSYGEVEDYIVNVVCPTTYVAPTASAVTICSGLTAGLTAVSTYTTSLVNWYATPTGGSPLATGTSFTSPALTSNTTYYVSDSIHGCGVSTRTAVNVTVNQPTTATVNITNCGTYTWPINSTAYTTSGTHTATIVNAAGCDSVITLNLTINQNSTATQTITNCGSYTWPLNGTVYAASGTFTATIPNAAGCDSLVTLNLTVNQSTTASQTVTNCGDYLWDLNGNVYTATGVYVDTIPNAVGCDSIVTLNLTVNQATSATQTVVSCGAYDWALNGNNYTATGLYIDTIANAAGCDSIITLDLTVINTDLTVTNSSPTLTSNEVGAGTTYQWIDCGNGNAPIAGATAVSYTATVNGSYAVIVTKNNCSDTSACEAVANIGLKEVTSDLNVTLSPNPTNDFVKVQYADITVLNIDILDATGKVIFTQTQVANGEKVDFRNFERGVYIVRMTSDKGTKIERIVKK